MAGHHHHRSPRATSSHAGEEADPIRQLRSSQQQNVLASAIKDQTPSEKPLAQQEQKQQGHATKLPPGPPLVSVPLVGCDAITFAARGGRVGMKNLGNTCFMNTGLQCLSHVEPFAAYFLTGRYKEDVNEKNPRGCKGQLAHAFYKLQYIIWLRENAPIDPTGLHKLLTSFHPRLFESGEQQDVQEFLAFCLNSLHEDLNRANSSTSQMSEQELDTSGKKLGDEMLAAFAWRRHLQQDKSFIVDLLQGQLCSSLTCRNCGHTAKQYDPFLYLSVPVTQEMTEVTEALDKFHEEELLTQGEQWYCDGCQSKSDATKKMNIWKLPPVLVLHLKRFACDPQSLKFRKLVNALTVPLELDLTTHCSSKQRHGAKYDLVSAALHQGKYGSGHYAAICRVHGFEDGYRWFFFDDPTIQAISADQAGSMASKHGYVLFFVRRDQSENAALGPKRQTVTSPESWPHLASARNSIISDVVAGRVTMESIQQEHTNSPLGTPREGKKKSSKPVRPSTTNVDLESFVNKLGVGDKVHAVIVNAPGTIRFIGDTNFSAGEWIGVELDDPVGKNDGSVQGVSYFKCKPQSGLFVRRTQLKPVSSPSKGASSAEPSKETPSRTRKSKAKTMQMNDSVDPDSAIVVSGKAEMKEAIRACAGEVEKLQNVVQRLSKVLENDAKPNNIDIASNASKTPPPAWAAGPLQPEHKKLLDKLLKEASDRLGERLEKRLRGPLTDEVRRAVASPLEDIQRVTEKVKKLHEQRLRMANTKQAANA